MFLATFRNGCLKFGVNYCVPGGRKVYKYEKWERDQVISALDGGLSLRQCSDVFNIPRKTLAKWKSERIRSECPDGDAGMLLAMQSLLMTPFYNNFDESVSLSLMLLQLLVQIMERMLPDLTVLNRV